MRSYWAEHEPRNRYRIIHVAGETREPLCGTSMFRLYRVRLKDLDPETDLRCGSCAFVKARLREIHAARAPAREES